MDNNTDTQNNIQMITARFIGADGSEGYKNNETYTLKRWTENEMIFVSREDGSGQVAYDSEESLSGNFEMVPTPEQPQA